MVDVIAFKAWLEKTTTYSPAVVGDMGSRVKRADKILEITHDEMYQYKLEQMDEYKVLSVSVRSQIKKSVKLYHDFINTNIR